MARKPLLFGLGITGIIVLLVVLGLGVGAVTTVYTSKSSFCDSCHEMSTQYVSWTRSTHAKVECIDCHSGVGVKDYIDAKIGGIRQAVVHYFGDVGKIVAHVNDPVCLQCHYFNKASDYQYATTYKDDPLYVPDKFHQVHFKDTETKCTTCHARLVHGSVDAGGAPIQQQVCVDCHTRKKIYVDIKMQGVEEPGVPIR